MNDTSRSPPGTWRVFAPAVLAWALVAGAIGVPGCGRWLGVAALTVGVLGIACVRTRRGGLLLPFVALGCAMLVVLSARIDALELIRADPQFAEAAARQSAETIDLELRGFPRSSWDSSGRRSSWVRASAHSERGGMPVVLWFDDDVAPTVSPARSAAISEATPGNGRGESNEQPVGPSHSEGAALWGPGTPLRVVGTLVALDPGSSARYGVRVASFEQPHDDPAVGAWGSLRTGTVQFAAHLRVELRDAASSIAGAELVPGFAVGDTSLVPERLDSKMQESSLTHLVAVSGANCALVVGAMTALAGWLGVPRRGRLLLGGLALAGFVTVVGPDPSLQRAAVMAGVVLLSSFGGKRAIALPGLGLAILVLLIADPWQALQPGFALSVAATAGILLWVPDLTAALGRAVPSPRWVRLPIAVAVAAQFACGPLLLLVQAGFPAAGFIANVLAAPAAPWGTGLGLLAMLAAPAPMAASVLVWLGSLPARWIAATAEVTSALPGARWSWPGGWLGALLLAAVEAAVLVAWWLLERRIGERGSQDCPAARAESPVTSGPVPWKRKLPRRRRVVVCISGLLCAAIGVFIGPTLVVPTTERLTIPNDWSVVACDVGQGDAFLLRDPQDPDAVMLVDTGDDREMLGSCLDRFGVQRIAILVLTHDDRDHVGALSEVLDRVDQAIVAPNNREDGDVRPVLAQLHAAQVPTQIGARGMADAFGDLSWEVLAPEPGVTPPDTNGASLVLRVRAGDISVLMLADTGEDEQLALHRTGVRLEADVLKVAHHGSADHDPGVFAATSAEVALISVGAENSYGHPAASTIAGLRRSRTAVLRTDQMGAIAVSGAPGALDVWAEDGE